NARALAVHFLALAAFALTTHRIVNLHFELAAHPGLLALLWCATGAITLGAWMLVVWPVARWRTLANAGRRGIAWGSAVGIGVWAAGFVTAELWKPLARWTFTIVNALLHLIYPVTISNATTLVVGTPAFKVRIAPECSGYEGIGL